MNTDFSNDLIFNVPMLGVHLATAGTNSKLLKLSSMGEVVNKLPYEDGEDSNVFTE